MSMECPECGAVLTAADRDRAGYRCGRCDARITEPRRAPGGGFDDAPRRSRGKPEGRSGCRTLLIVLVVLGGLLLLICGGIIGALYVAGKPEWEEFRSPAGGYTVQLPAKPRPDMQKLAQRQGPVPAGVVCEGTLLVGRLEEYSVVYADLPGDAGDPDDARRVLDKAVEALQNGQPPARVVSSKDVTVSGYPGRELQVRMQEQHRLARIVLTDKRIYTVIAGGPLSGANEPRVRKFVESFQLVEPKPKDADE